MIHQVIALIVSLAGFPAGVALAYLTKEECDEVIGPIRIAGNILFGLLVVLTYYFLELSAFNIIVPAIIFGIYFGWRNMRPFALVALLILAFGNLLLFEIVLGIAFVLNILQGSEKYYRITT